VAQRYYDLSGLYKWQHCWASEPHLAYSALQAAKAELEAQLAVTQARAAQQAALLEEEASARLQLEQRLAEEMAARHEAERRADAAPAHSSADAIEGHSAGAPTAEVESVAFGHDSSAIEREEEELSSNELLGVAQAAHLLELADAAVAAAATAELEGPAVAYVQELGLWVGVHGPPMHAVEDEGGQAYAAESTDVAIDSGMMDFDD